MPGPDNNKCPGCGGDLGANPVVHGPGCPAVEVRVTDKREQRRLEAEQRRLEAEATAAEAASLVDTSDPAGEGIAEGMQRVDRIAEFRAKAAAGEELTDEEQQELLRLQGEQMEAEKAAEEAELGVSAKTAFLVIIGHDGSATATTDMDQLVNIDREASIDDMYAGASIVVRDIEASLAAKHVVFGIQVAGQAMAEKRQAVQTMQNLQMGAPGGRRRR
jgi:uncharacterized Zn finger protein (UPF0148 family)